ncbi:YopX family protein [Lactococcus lactis]|uniref:YopX family protein n=1 Tax=Lactococcus lactis TaxID=1358 RepID=UPI003561AEEF
MIPKLRAWDKVGKSISSVSEITYSGDLSYLSFVKLSGNNRLYGPESRLADDVIIMQSTGLTDKNGVEIYEGDIVRVTDEDESADFCDGGIGTINGLDELFMWYIDGDVENGLFDINSSYYIEVIGNIYENPELLKGAAR